MVRKEDTKSLLKSGYLPQSEAEQQMRQLGYGYDKTLSSMQTKVFISPQGKPTIVHRGSVTAKDWIDDGLIALGLGKLGHRYKDAVRVTKRAEDKYKQAADTVSHSYGGWLSENSLAHGEIVTYNKAAGLGDIFKQIPPNQTDIRTAGDLASLLSETQYGGTKQRIPNKNDLGSPLLNGVSAHFLNNLE